MRFWTKPVLVLALLILSQAAGAAPDKWYLSDFGISDPQKLILAPLATPNAGLELRILSYFAEMGPDTALGLFARAKLADPQKSGAGLPLYSGAASARTLSAIASDDALKVLAQGTAVKVMTSSTAREFSLEGPDHLNGRGAFTAAPVKGLAGEADRKTGDGDGYLSVRELETYVARRVPDTTHGKQHPTTVFSSKFQDYPVIRGQS